MRVQTCHNCDAVISEELLDVELRIAGHDVVAMVEGTICDCGEETLHSGADAALTVLIARHLDEQGVRNRWVTTTLQGLWVDIDEDTCFELTADEIVSRWSDLVTIISITR